MVVQKCHASLVPTDTGVNVGNSTADRTTVARVNFEHAVGAAWDSLSAEQVEPIWNTGFWKCIFGNDSLGDALIQQVKRSMPSGDYAGGEPGDADKRLRVDSPQTFSAPLFQTCVKSTDDISWHEKREALLQKSLKHWLVLTTTWRCDIELVMCMQGCDSNNSQHIMLGDVFRGKSPSTLTKRANSMKLLCNILSKVGLEFPCSESSLYGVLCELRRQGAPPSRGKGILEAIAFVRYTMGILECEPLLTGRRCWGATTSDEPIQRTKLVRLDSGVGETSLHTRAWCRQVEQTFQRHSLVHGVCQGALEWCTARYTDSLWSCWGWHPFCGSFDWPSQDYEGPATSTSVFASLIWPFQKPAVQDATNPHALITYVTY